MSGSPASPAASAEPPSPGGFKSFWKRSSKAAQSQNLTFVQQDPSGSRKGGVRRLFRGGSSAASPSDDGRSATSDAKKRRQQVYEAQRRHRNRKAEYIQSLEAEVAQLQHMEARVNDEKNLLLRQNKAIRDFLAAQSLDAKLSVMDLAPPDPLLDDLSQYRNYAVDVRYDEDMKHDRTFLDFNFDGMMDWMTTTSEDTAETDMTTGTAASERTERPPPHTPVKGDSYAALDFILALEWPCKDHVHHPFINPAPTSTQLPDPDALNTHTLTTTAAVMQSALPPLVAGQRPPSGTPGRWQLPHSEIDKLVKLSEELQLDDELLTPAQAYSAIREHIPEHSQLIPILQALKIPLGSHMQCHGFGACVETQTFWQHLETTLQSMIAQQQNITT